MCQECAGTFGKIALWRTWNALGGIVAWFVVCCWQHCGYKFKLAVLKLGISQLEFEFRSWQHCG